MQDNQHVYLYISALRQVLPQENGAKVLQVYELHK